MSDKPDPKDYPDRVNDYVKAMRRWRIVQPLPPIPQDLEHLFTPESLEAARAVQSKKSE